MPTGAGDAHLQHPARRRPPRRRGIDRGAHERAPTATWMPSPICERAGADADKDRFLAPCSRRARSAARCLRFTPSTSRSRACASRSARADARRDPAAMVDATCWRAPAMAESRAIRSRPLLLAIAQLPAAGRAAVATDRRPQFDLYDEPMPTLPRWKATCDDTSSALFSLAARILAGAPIRRDRSPRAPCRHRLRIAGAAALPLHAARRSSTCRCSCWSSTAAASRTFSPASRRRSCAPRSQLLAGAAASQTAVALLRRLPPARAAGIPAAGAGAPLLERMERADYDPFGSPIAAIPQWRAAMRICGVRRAVGRETSRIRMCTAQK